MSYVLSKMVLERNVRGGHVAEEPEKLKFSEARRERAEVREGF